MMGGLAPLAPLEVLQAKRAARQQDLEATLLDGKPTAAVRADLRRIDETIAPLVEEMRLAPVLKQQADAALVDQDAATLAAEATARVLLSLGESPGYVAALDPGHESVIASAAVALAQARLDVAVAERALAEAHLLVSKARLRVGEDEQRRRAVIELRKDGSTRPDDGAVVALANIDLEATRAILVRAEAGANARKPRVTEARTLLSQAETYMRRAEDGAALDLLMHRALRYRDLLFQDIEHIAALETRCGVHRTRFDVGQKFYLAVRKNAAMNKYL